MQEDKVVLALRESLRRGVEGPPVDPDGLASFSPETARLIREHNARVRRNEGAETPALEEAPRFVQEPRPSIPFETPIARPPSPSGADADERHGYPGGFRLLDILAGLAAAAVLIVMIVPVLQASRESARRARCALNLNQLGIAAGQYHTTFGNLPPSHITAKQDGFMKSRAGASVFVRLLPFMARQADYNHYNFAYSALAPQNTTVAGMGSSSLWCPSDPEISRIQRAGFTSGFGKLKRQQVWWQAQCSYAGSQGIWASEIIEGQPYFKERLAGMNGTIFGHSMVSFSDVSDGTSNTLLFGEHVNPNKNIRRLDLYKGFWWHSGEIAFSMEAYSPPNSAAVILDQRIGSDFIHDYARMNASSRHPDGANFAFVDGSVRFIHNGINSWPLVFGRSPSVSYDESTKLYKLIQGRPVGVFQALSTRSGDAEVIPDQF